MKLLLDTHFLVWTALDLPKVDDFPWLERYRPWGVSPVSFLELQFLAEVGKLKVKLDAFIDLIGEDPRFAVDEVPLIALVRQGIHHSWTRDPFDRLLAAHSSARRTPLCTVDRRILREHRYLPEELRER